MGEFISLLWPAWVNTFIEALVERAFEATGIYPPNADVVLNRFETPTPPLSVTPPEPSGLQTALNSPSWLKTKSLLRSAMEDKQPDAAGAVGQALH